MLKSETELECSWEGNYELAKAQQLSNNTAENLQKIEIRVKQGQILSLQN